MKFKKGDLVRVRNKASVRPGSKAGYLFVVTEVRSHGSFPIQTKSLVTGEIHIFTLDELEKANDKA